MRCQTTSNVIDGVLFVLVVKLSVAELQQMAALKVGMCCISADDFYTAKTKLLWKCSKGHEWRSSYDSVKRGSWCPVCAGSAQESFVQLVLQKIFGRPFVKCRPEDLLNVNGNRMEFDFWNEELNIAGEHNGAQHYKYIEKYKNDLSNRQKDDQIKIEYCHKKHIQFFVTKDFGFSGHVDLIGDAQMLIEYVVECLRQSGIQVSNIPAISDDDIVLLYSNNRGQSRLDDISAKSQSNCGTYLTQNTPVQFECNICHCTYKDVPKYIFKRNHCRCPQCFKRPGSKSSFHQQRKQYESQNNCIQGFHCHRNFRT